MSEQQTAVVEVDEEREKLIREAAWKAYPNPDDHPERIAFREGYVAAIASARPMIEAEEREKCAKEIQPLVDSNEANEDYYFCAKDALDAIRAMGGETP